MPISLGVDWYRLTHDPHGPFVDHTTGRRLRTMKRRFATTPPATSYVLSELIAQHPTATVDELRPCVHYDDELRSILDDYRSRGHGHLQAAHIFAH